MLDEHIIPCFQTYHVHCGVYTGVYCTLLWTWVFIGCLSHDKIPHPSSLYHGKDYGWYSPGRYRHATLYHGMFYNIYHSRLKKNND